MEVLPRGRHNLPPEFVAQNQRERLVVALTESVHKRGYKRTTVSAVCGIARVSKSDFYHHFDSKGDCFNLAYDVAMERLQVEVATACEERADWAQRLCAALSAAIDFLVREPACASLLLGEGLRGGRELQDRFQRALDDFTVQLREGAQVASADRSPPQVADEAVVGGIASMLERHIVDGKAEQLGEFFPDIAGFALIPYVGASEARRIIAAA